MKSKDEIMNITVDQLPAKLVELQEELNNLQLQKSTHQITNPLRIRTVRRNIARVRTVLAEIQKGIRSAEGKVKE
jgi:large subunit ribosomal protein L29